MRSLRSQLTLTVVAILLGALVVIQLRAQSVGASLDSKSIQDLTAIIAQLNAGNDQLREQKTVEEQTLSQVQSDLQQGQSAASDVQADLNRLRGWAGLDPIYGPGMRLTLSGRFPADIVQDAINELWNAGADGIAVEGIRVVPGIVVSGSPGALKIGGTSLGTSIDITAVGDQEGMIGALRRTGGFLAQLSVNIDYPDVSATTQPVDSVVLPATTRDLIPRDAQPRL